MNKYDILSASRMTDMPKYYPEQLIDNVNDRTNKGQMNHTLVMWTKHPRSLLTEPLYSFLQGLKQDGTQLYVQLTITGMGQMVMGTDINGNPVMMEPSAPTYADSIDALDQVIELVENPMRIRLRIDPLIRYEDARGEIQSNYELFEPILSQTAAKGIKTYSFSFVESGKHKKVDNRFAHLGLTLLPPTDEERKDFAAKFQELEKKYGVTISSCAIPGFNKTACISAKLLESLHDKHLPIEDKPGRSRPLCGCSKSIDIGGWPPKKCYTGCQYCYSHSSYK